MRTHVAVIAAIFLICALVGGVLWWRLFLHPAPQPISLSKSDMETLLTTLPPATLEALSAEPDEKRTWLSNLKQTLAVGEEGEKAGYADRGDVRPVLNYVHDLMLADMYQETNPDAKASQQEIELFEQKYSGDFRQFLAAAPGLWFAGEAESPKEIPETPEEQRFEEELRVQYATTRIYAERARKAGLGNDQTAALVFMLSRYGVLRYAYARDLWHSKNLVTDQDIQEYLSQHGSELALTGVRQILIASRAQQQSVEERFGLENSMGGGGLQVEEARAKAQSILDRINKGEDFVELAREYSNNLDPDWKGGEVNFLYHDEMPPALERAASGLKPGEVSGLVQTDDGFCIIKVEDRKMPDVADPEGREQIVSHARLRLEKLNQQLSDIADRSSVTIAEDFVVPSKPLTLRGSRFWSDLPREEQPPAPKLEAIAPKPEAIAPRPEGTRDSAHETVRKSSGVLQGSAIKKVEPPYPLLAKAARVTGIVVVEITIDEEGNVIAAHALSGHPLLRDAAVSAALQWKFAPTKLNPIPVKVIGTLTFNFES